MREHNSYTQCTISMTTTQCTINGGRGGTQPLTWYTQYNGFFSVVMTGTHRGLTTAAQLATIRVLTANNKSVWDYWLGLYLVYQ